MRVSFTWLAFNLDSMKRIFLHNFLLSNKNLLGNYNFAMLLAFRNQSCYAFLHPHFVYVRVHFLRADSKESFLKRAMLEKGNCNVQGTK